MNRRDFCKISLAAGFFSSILGSVSLWAETKKTAKAPTPDLVAIRGGSPAQMFEVGIKTIGGMRRFVHKGQRVLVKPNIGWNKLPSEGANTNPELVGTIVKYALQAGAAEVVVFDHTCEEWSACYKNSGIEKAVKAANGKMAKGNDEKDYRAAAIKGAKILKNVKAHQLYLDADVIINVPVLKHHSGTAMSAALKNLMGVVWDRRRWHREGLHQCIGEFPLLRQPDLTVVDAYNVMIKGGPRGITTNDLRLKKMQLISTDQVLADTAAAKILGATPEEISYLPIAEKLGLGTMNIDKSQVMKISL